MTEPVYDSQYITYEAFKSLLDLYVDFCKKLRFFIKGAFTTQEEALALEVISEFLDHNEKKLDELKANLSGGANDGSFGPESVEVLLGRLLMQNEDYKALQRIAEIRRNGGPRWEQLQDILQETRARDID
jgi:hypothetical protein